MYSKICFAPGEKAQFYIYMCVCNIGYFYCLRISFSSSLSELSCSRDTDLMAEERRDSVQGVSGI